MHRCSRRPWIARCHCSACTIHAAAARHLRYQKYLTGSSGAGMFGSAAASRLPGASRSAYPAHRGAGRDRTPSAANWRHLPSRRIDHRDREVVRRRWSWLTAPKRREHLEAGAGRDYPATPQEPTMTDNAGEGGVDIASDRPALKYVKTTWGDVPCGNESAWPAEVRTALWQGRRYEIRGVWSAGPPPVPL